MHAPATSLPRAEADPADAAGAAPPPRPKPRSRRRGRVAIWSAAFGVVAFSASALIALGLTRRAPSWWARVDATDPRVVATAQRVENEAANVLTRIKPSNGEGDPGKPWTVGIRATEANAWLNARLRTWLEAQEPSRGGAPFRWPEELGQLQVQFDEGRIYIGAVLRHGERERVVSAVLEPRFDEKGSLWLPAATVSVGRLPIPAGWVLGSQNPADVEAVPDDFAGLPQTREALGALAGENPMLRRPVIRLGDGRRVRLLGLHAEDGRLLVTCLTERH